MAIIKQFLCFVKSALILSSATLYLVVVMVWTRTHSGYYEAISRAKEQVLAAGLRNTRLNFESDKSGMVFYFSDYLQKNRFTDDYTEGFDKPIWKYLHGPTLTDPREAIAFYFTHIEDYGVSFVEFEMIVPHWIIAALTGIPPVGFVISSIVRRLRKVGSRRKKTTGDSRASSAGRVVSPNIRQSTFGRLARLVGWVSLMLCVGWVILWVRSRAIPNKIEVTRNFDSSMRKCDQYLLLQSDDYGVKWWLSLGDFWTPDAVDRQVMKLKSRESVDRPLPDPRWEDPSWRERFSAVYSRTRSQEQAEFLSAGIIPHWFAVGVTVLPCLLFGFISSLRLARFHRRKKQGRCPICGYDLRGTPGGCPECGNLLRRAI